MQNERPSVRSLIGMFALISGLIAYAFAAAAIGDLITDWPLAIEVVYYIIAGILWIFPARKILEWMGRGHKKD
jgi:uncharacterized membrane protein